MSPSRPITYPTISNKLPHFIYGGDYSPEQWPEEVWEQDMALMKQAGCSAMSIGIFSWVSLEPEDGVYTFDWLDKIMDMLHANGLYAVLATPSAAQPAWLSHAYPEVVRKGPDNPTGRHGYRVNFCPNSPVYRRKCREMAHELATRYKDHPSLILWHVSNEYYKECHCDICQSEFRSWLKHKYGTLDALNAAYWTAFWSHTYTDWDQIQSAFIWPNIEWTIPGQTIDWQRFTVDSTVGACANECGVLRKITPDIPITTNSHMTMTGVTDWNRFAPLLDVISWDAYPGYQGESDHDIPVAVKTSFLHDYYRSLKGGKPFMRMESSPRSGPGKKQMRPGILRLTALQSVAHGSDTVQFFQWRDGRGGMEHFHGGMVCHAGHADTRGFKDVAALGKSLKQYDALLGTSVPSEVAVIWDKEIFWGTELTTEARFDESGYNDTCISHYRSFWQRGIPTDVITMDGDFSHYKLIVAPMLYLLRPGVAERLEAFVATGGTLVTTYYSGYVDENDLTFTGGFPGPLRKLLGLWSEELDNIGPDGGNTLLVDTDNSLGLKHEYALKWFCDLIRLDTATPLASYSTDFYAGRPALTCNAFGKGKAYYHAAFSGRGFLDDFYHGLEKDIGLSRTLDTDIPSGVSVTLRIDEKHDYIFVLNYTNAEHEITLSETLTDLETGESLHGTLQLPPHASRVIVRIRTT